MQSKIKIFPFPTGLHSHAMVRVQRALSLPVQINRQNDFQITASIERANIIILHVIGFDAIDLAKQYQSQGKQFIVIQYCGIAGEDLTPWKWLWTHSLFVWSYYDLSSLASEWGFTFYYAPLGIDPIFTQPPSQPITRRNRIMTSGFVSHSSQEPIQEVWLAAERLGIEVVHLGPENVMGVYHTPPNTLFIGGIGDSGLRDYYHTCKWVSALRHVEGFEMGAIEGLSCGARPICFHRDEHIQWFGDHPIYIEEKSGKNLVDILEWLIKGEINREYDSYSIVRDKEIEEVRMKFDWPTIVKGFYSTLRHKLAHTTISVKQSPINLPTIDYLEVL